MVPDRLPLPGRPCLAFGRSVGGWGNHRFPEQSSSFGLSPALTIAHITGPNHLLYTAVAFIYFEPGGFFHGASSRRRAPPPR